MKREVTKKKVAAQKTPLSRTMLRRIKQLGEPWVLDDKERHLTGVFHFSRYLDGFMFATRIAVHAEVIGHHPELCITPRTVTVTLTTDSQKQVTELDIDLAERINRVISTRR